jgi:hypothetical protein
MVRYSAEMREIIEHGSLTHRSVHIRGFVKDIKVTSDQAVVICTTPELSNKVELDIGGVPNTVQYGGRYCTIGGTRTFELAFALSL